MKNILKIGSLMLFTSLLEAKEFSQDKSTKEYGVYFLIPEGEVKNKALDISKRLGNDITSHITVLQTVCNVNSPRRTS
jgi:hypothetical protein